MPSNAETMYDTPGMRSPVTPILTRCAKNNAMRIGIKVTAKIRRNGFSNCARFSFSKARLKRCLKSCHCFFKSVCSASSMISIDSLEFSRLKASAAILVISGAMTPMINWGICFIQRNKGGVFFTIVHHVPAVQMVRPIAKPLKVNVMVALNALRQVSPCVLKSLYNF